MHTIAVYSLKGGVGKTTLAVSLAWASATRSARRTLLWDVDPQAAASFLLGDGRRGKQEAQAVFAKDVDPVKLSTPPRSSASTCFPPTRRCAVSTASCSGSVRRSAFSS